MSAPGRARLDGVISRHDTRRPPAAGHVTDPVPATGPAPERCDQGGLDAVINGNDLITATTHFGQCTACQREFLSLGGLLPPPARPAAQSQAASVKPARASVKATEAVVKATEAAVKATEAAEPAIRIS